MSKFVRIAVIGAATVALAGGTATAAFAGTPSPSPSISHNIVIPTPTPLPVRFTPEHFTVVLSKITLPLPVGPLVSNHAVASGPVAINGTDTTVSGTQDRLGQTLPVAKSVNVRHRALRLSDVSVNYQRCLVTVNQTSPWTFNGGTGAYLNARGFGTETVNASLHFPNRQIGRFSVCSLRFISQPRIVRDLNGAPGLPVPDSYVVLVNGSGRAHI